MKLHINTHPWLSHAQVLVDGEALGQECVGVDLERRIIYKHGPAVGRLPGPDIEVFVPNGTRLALILDGHEVITRGIAAAEGHTEGRPESRPLFPRPPAQPHFTDPPPTHSPGPQRAHGWTGVTTPLRRG